MPFLDLVFDVPLREHPVFTYRMDPKGEAAVGKRVMAPFGRREMTGYVVGERPEPPPGVADAAIKAIRRVVDAEPIFDQEDIELSQWMAGYYLCGPGEALAAMIPSGRRIGGYSSFADASEEIASAPLALSEEQEAALAAIAMRGASGEKPRPCYLFGVTGSGKTEVFLRAAEDAIARGRSAIYLVPEISLTHQTAQAIGSRFGAIAATLHSGMTPSKRLAEWMRIRSGEARIVVGPRSAVFAPLRNLGLIIIDEEH
ncbi:MAG: DEAD/DEAH box helicase, partial [Treponema sp.]|nr:DEAD/DEAH box helicase [Treponema sp.]